VREPKSEGIVVENRFQQFQQPSPTPQKKLIIFLGSLRAIEMWKTKDWTSQSQILKTKFDNHFSIGIMI